MTLYGLLERHLQLADGAARPLVVTSESAYTSADIARESAKIAAWLRSAGIEKGERVIVDLKNGFGAVSALFGVTRAGGIVVGGSPQWTVQQFEHVLADSGARFVVTGELRAKQIGEGRPPHMLIDGPWASSPRDQDGIVAWGSLTDTWDGHVPRGAEDPAILIYTSGSTGRPKGVVHSHQNLEDFARIVAGYLANTADDRLLWLLGWSFGYGLSQLLTMCFVGGRVVVPASMMPADIMKAHDEHGTTGLALVPYAWEQLLAFLEKTGRELRGLRYATNAGDGPSASLVERLPRALLGARIILMYGQTECFRTTFLDWARYHEKPGAMGFALPGVEAHVLTDDGAPCAAGEVGELHHRGALVALGYWQAPEATEKKFYRVGETRGLRTGDMVRRDEDGCLWYVARSERMIKSAGFRFSPSEIEDPLRTHGAVGEVVVFGVDDELLGQAVEAAVVFAEEATTTPHGETADVDGAGDAEAALTRALLAHLRPQVPRYMLPRRIHRVDAIPRNPRGKIKLDALRALSRS